MENLINRISIYVRKAPKLCSICILKLELFDCLVLPTLLFGYETYASQPFLEIEKVHIKFCNYLLSVSNKTSNRPTMVYGETGRKPLEIDIKTRTLSFWSMLVTGKQSKLSFIMYCLLVKLDENNIYTSEWIRFIRNTLNIGVSRGGGSGGPDPPFSWTPPFHL